jgi:hypothetical protein
MDAIDRYLPVASLIVASLAVFVGPWMSWLVVRWQSEITLQVALKQAIAPI